MIYKNSTELMQLAGYPVYMSDIADACLLGRLNLFMIGDTGSGKTQLARDMMDKFGDKTVYILGRNDMDTRELFQQVNPEYLRALRSGDVSGQKFIQEALLNREFSIGLHQSKKRKGKKTSIY